MNVGSVIILLFGGGLNKGVDWFGCGFVWVFEGYFKMFWIGFFVGILDLRDL